MLVGQTMQNYKWLYKQSIFNWHLFTNYNNHSKLWGKGMQKKLFRVCSAFSLHLSVCLSVCLSQTEAGKLGVCFGPLIFCLGGYTYFRLTCYLKTRRKCADLWVSWAEVSMTCTVVQPTVGSFKTRKQLITAVCPSLQPRTLRWATGQPLGLCSCLVVLAYCCVSKLRTVATFKLKAQR